MKLDIQGETGNINKAQARIYSPASAYNATGLEVIATGTDGDQTGINIAVTGSADTNVGMKIASSGGGTNNYGLLVTAGKVGIGTTSPLDLLTIEGDSSPTLRFQDTSGAYWRIGKGYTAGDDETLYFHNGTVAQGMYKTLTGLGIGTTSPSYALHIVNAATPVYVYRSTAGGGANANAHFASDSGGTNTITCTIRTDGDIENTNNSYTGISDLKLKTNITDASSQWNDIKALRVRNFELKSNVSASIDKPMIGVIAQELEASGMSGLVKDVSNPASGSVEQGPTYKVAKYSILYMKAVKALQEAMERIEGLESKVEALENA